MHQFKIITNFHFDLVTPTGKITDTIAMNVF